ncbi:alanine racemase [Pseudoclavibacter chungangensis]|uniref:alanine racemase C-terminal domain-containing protein n=1 Tax=Pseudoclavibacter chungangensis TaxID=587635 RepID=UPI0015CCCDEB|nr:alanine racemase C-terminal domain-containing protein [Pseudoclavibacter chungangensis]NYJ66450.1 alanine racemase [Pseudoclavibacter chungangensis]
MLRNIASLGLEPGDPVDLRAGAYGHGAGRIADVLGVSGTRTAYVSTPHDADEVRRSGLDPVIAEPGDPRPDAAVGPALLGLTDRSLSPALRLAAEVLAVKTLAAGEGVSYGFSYRTTAATNLALVGIGYAHGAVRRATNRSPVLVGGVTGTISGAISMDQFSVDVHGADVEVGSDAVLFGDPARGEPHVLDWAGTTGIAAAAICARIAPTVERILA